MLLTHVAKMQLTGILIYSLVLFLFVCKANFLSKNGKKTGTFQKKCYKIKINLDIKILFSYIFHNGVLIIQTKLYYSSMKTDGLDLFSIGDVFLRFLTLKTQKCEGQGRLLGQFRSQPVNTYAHQISSLQHKYYRNFFFRGCVALRGPKGCSLLSSMVPIFYFWLQNQVVQS